MFLPHPRVKVSIVGSLRDREVACSASDRQGLNFESCVWRTVSSQSSHHPQEVLLAQLSLYVHKGGLKPDSFHLQRVSCAHIGISAVSHHGSNKISKRLYAHNGRCLWGGGGRGGGGRHCEARGLPALYLPCGIFCLFYIFNL